ncbi:MAG: restriction endonuclease subunit S [Clostridiales bacterium]|nr:restriction endonuclease subunit S [Clostridiales bacterium]
MVREMKDSGLEWAGVIPAEWTTNKGKYFMQLLARPVDENDGVITCFRDGEVTLRSNRREEGFTFATVEAGYQGIEPGDLVVHGMDGFAGAIGISDSRGKGTPALNVLDCSENKKYIMYLLRTMAHTELFMALATGIRVRTCDTSWKKLRELDYIIPPTTEQERIVAFIEKQCTEIDALMADVQAQIETLEQYKRSVITEAVTKGLNPNVPMKDSGTAWIDTMPSHWALIPAKYMFHNSDLRRIGDDVLLTSSQKYGIISQTDYMERENAKIVLANKGIEDWKHVEPYDFIISLRSFQGGLEMSETTGCITWHYVVLKASRTIVPKYYKWLFKSQSYITALQRTCNFIRDGQDLRFSNFSQVPLPEPPIEEQQAIASYLDAKCTEIDAIIDGKRQQLAVLEDYKKSVIFEYVTGKKEVPVA